LHHFAPLFPHTLPASRRQLLEGHLHRRRWCALRARRGVGECICENTCSTHRACELSQMRVFCTTCRLHTRRHTHAREHTHTHTHEQQPNLQLIASVSRVRAFDLMLLALRHSHLVLVQISELNLAHRFGLEAEVSERVSGLSLSPRLSFLSLTPPLSPLLHHIHDQELGTNLLFRVPLNLVTYADV
jgi:hypothetical protein